MYKAMRILLTMGILYSASRILSLFARYRHPKIITTILKALKDKNSRSIPPRHNPAPIFQVSVFAPNNCPAPTISISLQQRPRDHTSPLYRRCKGIASQENNSHIPRINQSKLLIDKVHETGIREIPRGSTNLRRQKQKELT